MSALECVVKRRVTRFMSVFPASSDIKQFTLLCRYSFQPIDRWTRPCSPGWRELFSLFTLKSYVIPFPTGLFPIHALILTRRQFMEFPWIMILRGLVCAWCVVYLLHLQIGLAQHIVIALNLLNLAAVVMFRWELSGEGVGGSPRYFLTPN